MIPSPTAYLFLELAVIVYLLGYCWEYIALRELSRRPFFIAACGLAMLWFAIDQVALQLDLWTFPYQGTLPFRIFSLPMEEYFLFFLHTLVCFVLLRQYSSIRR